MQGQLHEQLVDDAIQAYVEWREECAAVWDAFYRWASGPGVDAAAAFSTYRAALDREECASHAYADLLTRLRRRGRQGAAGTPERTRDERRG